MSCEGSGGRVQVWAVSVLGKVSKRLCVCLVCGKTVEIVFERNATAKARGIVGSH